mmetsp:Transcript_10106/g.15137  ORF Transcript_10106/g.15137 Transcript_10106/m.15137 type:complete len:400 (-) Transcript_10106:164-1363(-)
MGNTVTPSTSRSSTGTRRRSCPQIDAKGHVNTRQKIRSRRSLKSVRMTKNRKNVQCTRSVQFMTFSELETFDVSDTENEAPFQPAKKIRKKTLEGKGMRKQQLSPPVAFMEEEEKTYIEGSGYVSPVVTTPPDTSNSEFVQTQPSCSEKGMPKEQSYLSSSCSKMCESIILSELEVDSYSGILPKRKSADLKKRPMTLVLDMDETLLHSEFESLNNRYRQNEERKRATRKHDFEFIMEGSRKKERVRVYKRPGLDDFLEWAASRFEVIIFTAAIPEYAAPVLDYIDPKGRISHRLYRDSTCQYRGHNYVKDISLLGRDMQSTLLVDNNPMAMLACPDNAIPIQSFYDEVDDRELYHMRTFLCELITYADVRPHLIKKFGFKTLVDRHFGALEGSDDDDV